MTFEKMIYQSCYTYILGFLMITKLKKEIDFCSILRVVFGTNEWLFSELLQRQSEWESFSICDFRFY